MKPPTFELCHLECLPRRPHRQVIEGEEWSISETIIRVSRILTSASGKQESILF